MNLLLAGLASLTFTSDPSDVARLMTEHCEPFARNETSLEQARDGLVAAGFTVESDEEYADPPRLIIYGETRPPDFPARAIRLLRSDGAAMTFGIERQGPGCMAHQPGGNAALVSETFDRSDRWLPFPPRKDDGQYPSHREWLSPDGRLILSSELQGDWHGEAFASASILSAYDSPTTMLAWRERLVAADRRTPGEALIWAVQTWCPRDPGLGAEQINLHPDLADGISGTGTMQGGYLRADFRHRDPDTLVAWVYGGDCSLFVHGSGRVSATDDLRAWLSEADSGWTAADQADVWSGHGFTVTLSPMEFDEGPATRVIVRTVGAAGDTESPR